MIHQELREQIGDRDIVEIGEGQMGVALQSDVGQQQHFRAAAIFVDDLGKATGLGDYLKQRGVTDVVILGLATDYCVRWTALDARSLGFGVRVVEDGCRGVALGPDDVPNALAEMRAAGIEIVRSSAL